LQCPFIAKSEDHTRHRQPNVLKSFARSNLAIGGRIEMLKVDAKERQRDHGIYRSFAKIGAKMRKQFSSNSPYISHAGA
jgi:hypothetical protein